ncbi:MAG: Ku protein [Gemmatimonadota bacterium]|jgi:DNA end-binding protein Ku|nr:Ku protein [Gemmatimonadota bacterium]
MAARAIWKGRINLGPVELPVKLLSATHDRAIRFRLLDEKHGEPVRQKMVDADSKVVEPSEIRKALVINDGSLVILSDEELDGLKPEASREISITRFLKAGTISSEWYNRPYWLAPDGDQSGYFAFAEALRNEDREGIARWVMRGKEYAGVVRSHGDYLALITIHFADEVVPAARLDAPAGRDLSQKEVTMAKQIIEAMVDELDLSEFRDEYRERVMELIDAKAEGKIIRFPKASRRRKEQPLEEVLEASLKTTGGKGRTGKAGEKERTGRKAISHARS